MFFMQPSKYPMEWYTEHVKPRRMHLFTIIQLGLFIVLYVVKAIKAIAIAFPIVIALCIPIRLYLLPKVFTAEELVMIDSDDETVIAWLAARKEATKAPEPFESDEEMQQESDGIVQGSRVSADEAEQESEKDQVTPLPTEEYMKHRQERRKNRKKSISCPNNLLFSDAALAAAAAVAANETAAEDTADEDSNASDDGFHMVTVRPRRRRKKTISCPAHTLFAEAENHVSSNYFFG